MRNSVLIITRRGTGEWENIWKREDNNNCLLYKGDGSPAENAKDDVILCVVDGREFISDTRAAVTVKCIKREVGNTVGYIAAHGEDNTKAIFAHLGIQAATYSLGNNNQPSDGSLGDFVVKLAATIKNDKNKFPEALKALKNAIPGDRSSKAMGSFLTALAPLSLIQDQTIIYGVCKSLDDLVLDPATQRNLYTIFKEMGSELHGLADYIQSKNQGKVVDWALQNDSMLKSLARGYL